MFSSGGTNSMLNDQKPNDKAGENETVFVLRVRAGAAGWHGQLLRLDTGVRRYVAGHADLFALLASEWNLAVYPDDLQPEDGEQKPPDG